MALTINGVIAIKSVQKKLEAGYNNQQKTVYYGVMATKESFGQGLIDIDFKFECRNDKQVSFFDNYLMKYEGSGYATGKIIAGPNGLAVQLLEFEFGSFKLNGGNNGGSNTGNTGNNYGSNSNGYGNQGNGGNQNQGQISPNFSQGNGGQTNMFNGGGNQGGNQQGNQQGGNEGSNEVAGVNVETQGGGNIWNKFKKN